MNKNFLLLVGAFFLLSCEENGVMDNPVNALFENPIQTRAETSIADFDVLDELGDAGVPVNIVNKANSGPKYLLKDANGHVSLSNDKNNSNAKWGFNGNYVKYLGDWNSLGTPYLQRSTFNGGDFPYVAGVSGGPSFTPGVCNIVNKNEGQDGDYIISGFKMGTGGNYAYLRPAGNNNTSLVFDTNISNLSTWNVAAIGEYELVDISYVRTIIDDFNLKTSVNIYDHLENHTEFPQVLSTSLASSYSLKSDFSKTEGYSMTVSGGLNIGLPNLAGEEGSIGFNTTIQSQSSSNFTFGSEKDTVITIQRTVNVTAGPYTKMRVEIETYEYTGTLTYVATLRNLNNNKKFRVRGKWNGTCFSMFKCRIYDEKTNDLVKEEIIEEN